MWGNMRILASSTAICLVLAGSVKAADVDVPIFEEGTKPAVSGINGKLDLGYNYIDFNNVPGYFDAPYAIGTISFPVGHSFGVQIDAGYARYSSSVFAGSLSIGGGAVHAFWRNPDVALAGIYAHYVDLSVAGVSAGIWRLGAEAEIYLDRVSIEAFAGADLLNAPIGNQEFFMGDIYAAFYATDNIRLQAGVVHSFNNTVARIGGEAMLPFGANNVSLYANGSFGSGIDSVHAGLRIYFGESGKSLIDRHRQDDPKTRLTDFFGFDVNFVPPPIVRGCPPGTIDVGDGICVPITAARAD